MLTTVRYIDDASHRISFLSFRYIFQATFTQIVPGLVSDGTENLVPAGHVVAWYQKSFKTNDATPSAVTTHTTLSIEQDHPGADCKVVGTSAKGGFVEFRYVHTWCW